MSSARENLCRRNLRWLDQATKFYVDHHRRVPEGVIWPVELLPRLQDQVGREKHRAAIDVFTMDRPMFLTCPSRTKDVTSEDQLQTAHYELVIDRDKRIHWNELTWRFRDRPLEIPDTLRKTWYIGNELTTAAAEERLRTATGPHHGGFLESDSQGNVVWRQPIR